MCKYTQQQETMVDTLLFECGIALFDSRPVQKDMEDHGTYST